MTIEELEDKILSGDFDEYTLNNYRSAICSDQREIDIEKACSIYRNELVSIIDIFNKFGKELYYINELGELISLEGSLKDFRKAMEDKI